MKDGKVVYCTADDTVNPVGSDSKAGKMSPRNLWVTTIGDELARLVIKPESAIGVMTRREDGCSVFQGYTNHLRAVVGSQTEFITDGGYP